MSVSEVKGVELEAVKDAPARQLPMVCMYISSQSGQVRSPECPSAEQQENVFVR